MTVSKLIIRRGVETRIGNRPQHHIITDGRRFKLFRAEHGAEIGVDGKRLALVGNSVGGNMVAAVALQAKQFKTPAIRYDVMLWPVTDARFDTRMAGVLNCFACKATAATMLPPTLLPTSARRFPSTPISAPCSATHLVAS